MRLTSSYAIFRYEPEEKGLAKARWFSREGKAADAEREYRAALDANPDLRTGWLELFELLRRGGRHADALELALRAETHFGPDAAMPLALRGAALTELGRTRDAMEALEGAIERDGNLALAWHELAYAAFRSGEYSRALLVLDRAFALEPHTDTLVLRGWILREAGQYDAAEVAFEGAHQSAEHDIPRREAAREILATRRAAALGKRKPRDFTARERAFADLGAVVLDGGDGALRGAPAIAEVLTGCLAAVVPLARAAGWAATAVSGVVEQDAALAAALGRALDTPVLPAGALDAADRPLLVSVYGAEPPWEKQLTRLDRWQTGYALALVQPADATAVADVVGTLRCREAPAALYAIAARVVAAPWPPASGDEEVAALARNPLTRWRTRQSPPPSF